MSTLNLSNQPL